MNNTQANFPIQITIWALCLGRGFAKLEDPGIAHISDQLLRLFAELINFLFLKKSSPAGKTPCSGDFRTAESTF